MQNNVPVEGEIDMDQPVNGVKEKNFNNCPFKVTLPQISVLDGAIKLSFRLMSKPGISVDVSLNETYLSDKLHRKYDNYYMDECKPKESSNKNFALNIPIEKRSFMLSDSVLVLYFLAGDYRKYEIAYKYRRDTGTVLDYVMSRRLNDKEILRLEESIRQAKERAPKGDGGTASGSSGTDLGGNGQSYQIPKLEEYKRALLRENISCKKREAAGIS